MRGDVHRIEAEHEVGGDRADDTARELRGQVDGDLTVADEIRPVALRVQPSGQKTTAGAGTEVPVPAAGRSAGTTVNASC